MNGYFFLELKFGQSREGISEEVINEARKEFFSKNKYPYATLDEVLDHFDRVINLVGVDHVGIGSDLDGAYGNEQCPRDLDTIADLQKIPKILEERGYSESDIENIMSENFIRFLRKNWK